MATEGQKQLRDLSQRLKDAGSEGQGLRRELRKAIGDAADPLVKKIGSADHLSKYLPDRYAAVLADDLKVTASQRGVANPAVTVTARGRVHHRQVEVIEAGLLRHPVFPREGVPRRRWKWKAQADGIKPRFFADPCEEAKPHIRAQVLAAMHDVGQKITGA